MSSGASGYHSRGRTCPRCNAAVFRVSRRLVDLIVSVFVPIRRYRCRSLSCGWEGNLRDKQLDSLDVGHGQQHEDSKYHLIESSRAGRVSSLVKPPK